MDDSTYGFIDEAMLRPPQILGCERMPFLVIIGTAAFVTVVGFGLTFPGLVGGILLAAAGVMVLRRIAAHDPFWFAVLFEAARYPRQMPDVLPDRIIPRDLAFVGYDDPPDGMLVLLVRAATVAGVVLPAGATYAILGLVPALGTLALMAASVAYVIVSYLPRSQKG